MNNTSLPLCDEFKNSQYEIRDIWIDLKNEDNIIEYLNNLIWGYLKSINVFNKRLNEFLACCEEFKLDNPILNIPIEYNPTFNNIILEKFYQKFENFRDDFYGSYGIDLVDCYNMILLKQSHVNYPPYRYKLLRQFDKNYYPYKENNLLLTLQTTKPLHKIISMHSVNMEFAIFENTTKLMQRLKSRKQDLIQDLIDKNQYFSEMIQTYNEITNKEMSFNRLEKMKKSESKLKQAFIVFEIMKVHNIRNYAKATRVYNYFVLKRFPKDSLELSGSDTIKILNKGNTYQEVHSLIKLLFAYFP